MSQATNDRGTISRQGESLAVERGAVELAISEIKDLPPGDEKMRVFGRVLMAAQKSRTMREAELLDPAQSLNSDTLKRRIEVLRLKLKGQTIKEISARVFRSRSTVDRDLRWLREKGWLSMN